VVSNAFDQGDQSPPLIALSTYVERARFGVWDEPAALLPHSYVSAVTRAGGCPVLLPPSPSDPGAALAAVDALVLTGGPDVGPAAYGAEPHDQTDRPRPERDSWEMALCRGALQRGLPLLAICRGLQVLNVAMGGTLHQHLPEVLGHDDHRAVLGQTAPNRVALKEGSRAGAVLGPVTEGRCHHHQAVDRLGDRMDAVGFAEDGTVEAVEVRDQDFALGVQWHPEDNPADDRLFVALVQAARQHRDARRSPAPGPLARAAR
jgi:gamma-glutamyl-gamma-aminobutyrate hydrolase PuuD